jgi:hypothetical protein
MGGQMTLKTLPDLFLRCRGRKTGHWRAGGDYFRTVYLDSGDIVFASSNFPSDRLTTILVEHGKLTKDQMDHAMANLKPGISVGKNLIEMGFITQRDLLDVARLQVEQIVGAALMAPDAPTFDNRDELEETIVRLPLDTPALLFASVTKIADRDVLLELLGPLKQVVLLQVKRVFEMDLPADLLKMAKLMDGTRTILELSNEAAVEPMRTGIFALFLREMGWGKIIELPPLDRSAITKALDTPEPTKPPESIPPERSKQLFDVIEAAGAPTMKLDHLSAMLDDLPNANDRGGTEEQPPSAPEAQPPMPEEFEPPPIIPQQSVGRIIQLTPEPLESPIQQEPQIKIDPGSLDENEDDNEEEDDDGEAFDEPKTASSANPMTKKRGKKRGPILFLLLLAIVLTAAAYFVWQLRNRPNPPFTVDTDPSRLPDDGPAFEQPTQDEPAAPPQAEPPQPPVRLNIGGSAEDTEGLTPPPDVAPAPQPPTPSPSTPPPPPVETKADVSTEARFRSLADGNIAVALEQGKAHFSAMPKTGWTVRLIMACQNDSLQNCANTLAPMRPDFFLMPFRLRDGRSCYQLFVGRYASQSAAETESKKMANAFQGKFLVEPKVWQISEIKVVQ